MVRCTCFGDVTGDSVVNGKDISLFVNCVLGGAGNSACADLNHSGSTTTADIALFVTHCVVRFMRTVTKVEGRS